MGFVIEADLLRGVYEAGSADEREGDEWPPNPARLLCSLVAAADGRESKLDAVRWLEQQPAPAIYASAERVSSVTRANYVPLNMLDKPGAAYGRFPVRKAGAMLSWRHVSPDASIIKFAWHSTPPADVADRLGELAGEVPYLGRATSPVEMRAYPVGEPDSVGSGESNDADVFFPGGVADTVAVSLPRAGYVDELVEAFNDGRPAHEVGRSYLRYGRDGAPEMAVHPSPFDPEMVVLPFADGRRVGSAYMMMLSNAVRKAVQSHLDGGPLVLRGARRGEQRPRHQILILGLPDVGHQHASGMIAGVAFVVPTDIDIDERRGIFGAISAIEDRGVTAGRLGLLSFTPNVSPLRALDPQRWTRPSQRWVSATPMTADRYVDLRKTRRVQGEIQRACVDVDLPEPRLIDVSREPLIDGAQNVPARLRQRKTGEPVRPSFHVRIEFADRVCGPIVLGNLRRYGLGLMLPERAS